MSLQDNWFRIVTMIVLITGLLFNAQPPQTAQAATAGITLTVSPEFSSTVGDTVVLTATLDPTDAAGSVNFKDGGNSISGCSAQTIASGVAACSTSALGAGSHTFTAVYSGDGVYDSSISSDVSYTVFAASTTTVLAVPTRPITFGQAASFTATVTSTGTPVGNVTLFDNGASLGSAALDGSGVAVITVANLSAGVHSLAASFSETTDFYASTSAAEAYTVTQAAAVLDFTFSPANAVYGEPITLTAQLSVAGPGAGLPTGVVSFTEGANTLGTSFIDENGLARLTTVLSQGSHTISANYAGTINHAGSSDSGVLSIGAPDLLLTITHPNEWVSNPGYYPGGCEITGATGVCATLRDAIDLANAASAGDKITIQLDAANYQMMLADSGVDDNTNGDYDLFHSLNIIGQGSESGETSIVGSYAGNIGRLFHVRDAIVFNLSRLLLRDGYALAGADATESAASGNGANGGAINNEGAGVVKAYQVLFYSNHAGTGGSDQSGYGQANGAGGHGGAIFNPQGGIVDIFDSDFQYNSAGNGGGRNDVSPLANAGLNGGAGGHGGAIYNAGALNVFTSEFTSNNAGAGGQGSSGNITAGEGGQGGSGGAIYNTGAFSVTQSNFFGNLASPGGQGGYVSAAIAAYGNGGVGGAIAVNDANALIQTSTFQQNGQFNNPSGVGGEGGAVCASSTSSHLLTILRSSFNMNAASIGDPYSQDGNIGANGGAVAILNAMNSIIENSTFYSNSAGRAESGTNATSSHNGGNGGALYVNSSSTITLTNTTFRNNITGAGSGSSGVEGVGGAIYYVQTGSGRITLANSVISENMGGGTWTNDDCAGSALTSGDYNFIFNAAACSTFSPAAHDLVKDGTVYPMLATYADYGGPVKTLASSRNSVTANRIPPGVNGCGTSILIDQRGMPRPRGNACDIGSFETGSAAALAIINGDNQTYGMGKSGQTLQVTVRDEMGGSMPYHPMVFSSPTPQSGAGAVASCYLPGNMSSVVEDTDTSDPSMADTTCSANNVFGSYLVHAAADGVSVDFHMTNKYSATAALTTSSSYIYYGQPVTLTATLNPSAAGGSVTFKEDSNTIADCAAVAVNAGTAVCRSTAVPQGYSQSITALYNGDENYASSASGSQYLTVYAAQTTSSVAAYPAQQTAVGSSVVFTGTVIATPEYGGGVPTGALKFLDGGSSVAGCSSVTLNSSGQATCTTSSLTQGNHTITIRFTPNNSNYSSSISAGLAYTLTTATATTTSLAVAPASPAAFGETVIFTATLSHTAASGTVNFKDGGSSIGGCSAKSVASGVATCSTNALSVGSHTITAVYSGDTSYSGSTSSPLSYTIDKLATTTTLTASPVSTSALGDTVVFTATLNKTAASGTIDFKDGGSSISGCSAKSVASGVATCSTNALSIGSHTITAVYSGDTNYTGSSSAAMTYTVTKIPSSVTLSASPASSAAISETVIFTATVSPAGASGAVNFLVDNTSIDGCSAQPLASGVATCSTNSLADGNHTITAIYSGDASYAASTSNGKSYAINRLETTLTLSAYPASAARLNSLVYITATLNYTDATGTVAYKDGDNILNECSLAPVIAGVAVCSTSSLSAGSHRFTAVYSGDSIYGASDSAAITYTINKYPSASSLVASPAISTAFGQTLILTASIQTSFDTLQAGEQADISTSWLTPQINAGGVFTFKDGANTISGCNALAVVSQKAVCQVSSLTAGVHRLSAAYSGNPMYADAASVLTYTVAKASTTTAITTDLSGDFTVGQPVTVSVAISVVAPGAGNPAGLVTIGDGVTTCQATLANGTASCALTFTTAGTKTITAAFTDSTGNFEDSLSSEKTVTVRNSAENKLFLPWSPVNAYSSE